MILTDTTGRLTGAPKAHRSWRLLALALTLVAVVMAAGFGAVGDARAATTAEVATDALNLRTDPGTWGDVITVITWGESLEVLSGPTDDGWYEVIYGDEWGWVFGDYLSFDGVGGGGGGGERWIDVDRSSGEVTLFDGDSPVGTYWGSLGWDQTDYGYYATAIGTYYIYSKYADLAWTEYGQAFITDWVAFDPERNNGFHSWSMDSDSNVIAGGDGATGGCVALEPWAADEVYGFAEIGMRVEIHW